MLKLLCIFLSLHCTLGALKVQNFSNQLKKSFGAILVSLTLNPSLVQSSDYKQFSNERYHTKLQYPADWVERKAELSGGRSLDAFVDPQDQDTSASVAISAIPGDFTKLTSFGDLKGYLLPKSGDGISTSLVSESTKGNAYSIEYTISAPDAPTRHVRTVFGLRPQESVVGLTIQSKESKFEELKSTFDLISASFTFDSDYKQ